ncbi:hypothetical protein IWQ49_006423 [Labrenzia sp. EL_126]|nr:hypothetical protein [Labrenzia sp. EL_126]
MTENNEPPRVDPEEIRRAVLNEAAAVARSFMGQIEVSSWHLPEVIAAKIEALDTGE